MSFVELMINGNIATITLNRPKVNALNDDVIEDLKTIFNEVGKNEQVSAVVLIGQGSFFSFGFDVPGFMSYPKDLFERYVVKYSELIKTIFMFPKPVIAALNGYSVAGGCVLALACDYRIMVLGKAKIALNEMTFGSTLFSCVTETLKYAVGPRKAEQIIYLGAMSSAEEALSLGLVDRLAGENEFQSVVEEVAEDFSTKNPTAFASVKKLLKSDVLAKIESDESRSILEFVDIWYSDSTREQLAKIEIRD